MPLHTTSFVSLKKLLYQPRPWRGGNVFCLFGNFWRGAAVKGKRRGGRRPERRLLYKTGKSGYNRARDHSIHYDMR